MAFARHNLPSKDRWYQLVQTVTLSPTQSWLNLSFGGKPPAAKPEDIMIRFGDMNVDTSGIEYRVLGSYSISGNRLFVSVAYVLQSGSVVTDSASCLAYINWLIGSHG